MLNHTQISRPFLYLAPAFLLVLVDVETNYSEVSDGAKLNSTQNSWAKLWIPLQTGLVFHSPKNRVANGFDSVEGTPQHLMS